MARKGSYKKKGKGKNSSKKRIIPNLEKNLEACLLFTKRDISQVRPVAARVTPEEPVTCFPLDVSSPEYTLYFRKSKPIMSLLLPGKSPIYNPDGPNIPGIPKCPDFFISCVRVARPGENPSDQWDSSLPNLSFDFSIDLKFEQVWLLINQKIGDLSSSSGLAPGEQVTLEFLSSQRTTLDRQTLDSTEEMNSIENTINDKEVVNVVRASSKTDNWNASVNGGVDLGYFSLGGSGGSSGSTTESINTTQDHISEVTKKSSQSIKTLHKIEVRGISETFVQNRMTRTVKNPYRDRTLSINVFQLLKQFEVTTKPFEIRPSLIIKIDTLEWNDNFIRSHSDFLRNNLIDPSFVIDFDSIVSSVKEIFEPPEIADLVPLCKEALELLFDEPNIFNVYDIYVSDPVNQYFHQNSARDSLDASNPPMTGAPVPDPFRFAGLNAALENEVGRLYTILRFYQVLYDKFTNEGRLDTMALSLALTLRAIVDENWKDLSDAKHVNSLLYSNRFTEIFRRLSGFSAFFRSFIDWRMENATPFWTAISERDKSRPLVNRLIQHLNCNMNYYVQQFLEYISIKTNRQSINDFIDQVIDSTSRWSDASPRFIRSYFDVDRAFIEGQRIVIPAFSPFQPDANGNITVPRGSQALKANLEEIPWSSLVPTTDVVELPVGDSVHLEAVPGRCKLTEVPDEPAPVPTVVFKCDCGKEQESRPNTTQ